MLDRQSAPYGRGRVLGILRVYLESVRSDVNRDKSELEQSSSSVRIARTNHCVRGFGKNRGRCPARSSPSEKMRKAQV